MGIVNESKQRVFCFKFPKLVFDPYLPAMTLREINKRLKGKDITVDERFFRCIIAHLLQTEGIHTLYDTKKFCNYLISIGEVDGSEMFLFLKNRRQEFLDNTQEIIHRHLLVVE